VNSLLVAADRSPWIISPSADAGTFAAFTPDILPWSGSAEQACAGNAVTHQNDGQNVLFLDGRVSFETRSYCGATSADAPAAFADAPDNIYTISANVWTGDPYGTVPPGFQFNAMNKYDPSWSTTRTLSAAGGADPTLTGNLIVKTCGLGAATRVQAISCFFDRCR